MGVREWRRLKRIPQGSVENGVIRSYLEWLTSIPWPNSTRLKTRPFLAAARAQLDADHFGLEKIKKRLIEYLAVVRLKEKASRGPFSCKFVGPPGTGKTSLGQSVAKALDRPFQRISLGGVRDEAEIRGHRRTYEGTSSGTSVSQLKDTSWRRFLALQGGMEKRGRGRRGGVSSTLLEVLDPEQNHTFNDHYINVPIDLSQVLFICTANTLESISTPLLDRCEIIQLSGYTYDEKMHIARRFLLPKQLQANGLDASQINITEPALLHITTRYTREAGVRSLERAIGGVVRYKAVEWAESLDGTAQTQQQEGTSSRTSVSQLKEEERRGVVYGLVVMGQGEGGILPVETIAVPGSGKLKLTGSLGDVIKESGELALSWVKRHAYDLCITNSRTEDPLKFPDPIDIHLHLPAGAQKKDGPSAGVAMTCAFVSLLTGTCVPANIAMTGEITLRGRVTPVGGIKEKVLGAHRAQVTKVILPWANRKDVEHDVSPEIRNEMEFVFVRTVREALEAAFGRGTLGWRGESLLLESRL
ncbi:uncharacterized protein LACBIDRAFT_248873 [Laccaria bicolor S238N-H82]|uniref:endopeptidase La n=1 Tax=Laccaria bicolor (strain S238N-H82 / ATCC MYA-4686) TaxID=486041 RepID=B0D7C6_LACBS|nr:uncharacterized protein LACBIDRAFT_248873 [Laccaria bicolor S238N-H82]EDR09374.1 predicted protein [Laccaria bicolor S238N-H82]|eukprot:XP_001879723.1 predicted protein [Laccaria bicolor S238N-H82]